MTADVPFADRWPRRTRFTGGSRDGTDAPLSLPDQFPDPISLCRQIPGGWEHYVLQEDDRYHFEGLCHTIDHEGFDPYDPRPCCCGEDRCDGTGPWPETATCPPPSEASPHPAPCRDEPGSAGSGGSIPAA